MYNTVSIGAVLMLYMSKCDVTKVNTYIEMLRVLVH